MNGSGQQHIYRVGHGSAQTLPECSPLPRDSVSIRFGCLFHGFIVRGSAARIRRRDHFNSAHVFNFPIPEAVRISCILANRGEDNPTAWERRLRRGGDGRHIRGQPDSAGTPRQKMAWTAPRNDRGDDKGAVTTGRSKRLPANSGVVGSWPPLGEVRAGRPADDRGVDPAPGYSTYGKMYACAISTASPRHIFTCTSRGRCACAPSSEWPRLRASACPRG